MERNDDKVCYTIGHSNHQIENFIKLLKKWEVEYVIDIRSVPYSKHTKQFNKEALGKILVEIGFQYRYLGAIIGGGMIRFHNSSQIIPSFKEIILDEKFQRGIDILKKFVLKKGKKIALMCSERDPFICHRFFLVSYCLQKKDVKINHILSNGSLIENKTLEKKLRDSFSQTTLKDFKKNNASIKALYENHYLQIIKKFNH